MLGSKVARGRGAAGLLLLWGGYPLCVALGLDTSVGWLSNGYIPTEGELLGAVIVLAARVAQCVVAPMLLLGWLGWALTQGVWSLWDACFPPKVAPRRAA